MLTNFRLAVGTTVIARNALIKDSPVGKVIDTVIDSNTGNIEALWIGTGEGMRLLLTKDILHWKPSEIVITDENDLVVAAELPKLQKVLSKEVRILNTKVFGEFSKKVIGKVFNFAFDTISPSILSLQVRSGWGIFGQVRIIPRSKITRMTEEAIYVDDKGIKIKSDKKDSLKGDNPVVDQP